MGSVLPIARIGDDVALVRDTQNKYVCADPATSSLSDVMICIDR